MNEHMLLQNSGELYNGYIIILFLEKYINKGLSACGYWQNML